MKKIFLLIVLGFTISAFSQNKAKLFMGANNGGGAPLSVPNEEIVFGTGTGTTSGVTSNTDDYTINAELSGDTLTFNRLSGDTYSVILN